MLPLLHEHLVAVEVFAAARLGIQRLSLLLLVLFIGFLEIAQILRRGLHLKGRIAFCMHPVKLGLHRGRSGAFAYLLRGTVFAAGRRVLVDATLVVDLATGAEEGIQQIVSSQLLDHAHELLDASGDPLSIENGHQVVNQGLLVRQRDVVGHTLILKFLQHVVLVLVDLHDPLEELVLGLQICILALKHVVDSHHDHALENYVWSAESLSFTLLLKDAHVAQLFKE